MAFTTTFVAAVAAFSTVASYVASEDARNDAKSKSQQSAERQKQARAEQDAGNAAQAAAERRRQVREERVRRSRIMQAAENTGTTGSSGETGAIGSLATQLGSNLGANAGAIQRSQNISLFSQQSADFSFNAQQSMADANSFSQLASLSTNIFTQVGGMDALKTKATTTTPTMKQSVHVGGY